MSKNIHFVSYIFVLMFPKISEILVQTMIQNVTVIGAGAMGNGIAHVFAQNNFKVSLVDVSQPHLDKALATIQNNLDRQVLKNLITEEQKFSALQNITSFTSLAAGVQKADIVIEAATEN